MSACPDSPTFGYPCDPVCARCGQVQGFELPSPDGLDVHGTVAHWRLASGEWLFAQPGHVFGSSGGSLDAVEQDALCALAAVAWARQLSETPAGDSP